METPKRSNYSNIKELNKSIVEMFHDKLVVLRDDKQGTYRYTSEVWCVVMQDHGAESLVDHANTDKMFGECEVSNKDGTMNVVYSVVTGLFDFISDIADKGIVDIEDVSDKSTNWFTQLVGKRLDGKEQRQKMTKDRFSKLKEELLRSKTALVQRMYIFFLSAQETTVKVVKQDQAFLGKYLPMMNIGLEFDFCPDTNRFVSLNFKAIVDVAKVSDKVVSFDLPNNEYQITNQFSSATIIPLKD